MKQFKILVLILICYALPTNAQPLFNYSQFDLPEMFAKYKVNIKKTYHQKTYKEKSPMLSSLNASANKESWWYKMEEEIPLRKKLDSLIPTVQNYALFCPVYRVCNKMLVGVFPGGTEMLWQQPEGNLFYMITTSDGSSSVAVMYEKVTQSVREATEDEIALFYKELEPNMAGYASK